ncbi:MAG: hypothetical protein LBP39_00655, partial [Rickettsiales bacterium]|nr:hypothetical protein [Rickettsiales bacterium]
MSDNEENSSYELYRRKFVEQYLDEISIVANSTIENYRYEYVGNIIANNLIENLDIIWSSRMIKQMDNIGNNDIFFETDLHGDMRAFLHTLCETGAIKYKDGEDALIFYNPEMTRLEREIYTLDELEILKSDDIVKHAKLMR